MPQTQLRLLIAIAMMLVGIGFISIFTATVASFSFDQDKQDRANEFSGVRERLERLERKQDELLALVRQRIL